MLHNAARAPFVLGVTWIGVPVTLVAALFLLRGSRTPGTRLLGILGLAAGLTVVGLALFGLPKGVAPSATLAFPGPVLTLIGGSFAAWALLGAGRAGASPSWPRAALSLLAPAALTMNLTLFLMAPDIQSLALLGTIVERAWSHAFLSSLGTLVEIGEWTVAIVGFPLLILPALIVRERLGPRTAFAAWGRAVVRTPVPFVLGHVLFFVLAVLPIRELVCTPFVPTGLVSVIPNTIARASVDAVGYGLATGILVYATALVARGLLAAQGRDGEGETSRREG
jgi:hypothetical protein